MAGMSDWLESELRRALFRSNVVTVRLDLTAYVEGDRVMLGTEDLNVYECLTAGTSDSGPPTFDEALGAETVDGDVTWVALQQGAPKRPLWVSLHTESAADDGSGAEVSVTATGYGRIRTDPDDANWTAASETDGITANAAAIAFGSPVDDWGTISHVGLWDRETGGNLVAHGELSTPRLIENGDIAPFFDSGDIVVTWA